MTAVLQETMNNVLRTPFREPTAKNVQAQKADPAALQLAAVLPPPELNSAAKRSLESWFPLRKPLLRARGGSGRATSKRSIMLQLR